MKTKLIKILDYLDKTNIKQITFDTDNFKEEYNLLVDDKDYVTFHKGIDPPCIVEKLEICDYSTTKEPVYKDWYMTINYHA